MGIFPRLIRRQPADAGERPSGLPVSGPLMAAARRATFGRVALRALLHVALLLIAVVCLAAYEHLEVRGHPSAALVSLGLGALAAFAPLRDLVHVVFGIEGKLLHVVHALGGLGLVMLPATGVIAGGPLLTRAALAPFAMMGAAQAVMHQHDPRNARQEAALERFAASLPEVAQFTSAKHLTSPENAERAIAVLTDILAKAQALGETELDADPGFQSALRRVSTRFGATLGLDAVDLALTKMAANPITAAAVPGLRTQLSRARRALAGIAPS